MTRHPVPRSPLLTGIALGVGLIYVVLFWVRVAVWAVPMLVD